MMRSCGEHSSRTRRGPVGATITRVWGDTAGKAGLVAGLRPIGNTFGFPSPDALIALAILNLGGHRPVFPCRPEPGQREEPKTPAVI